MPAKERTLPVEFANSSLSSMLLTPTIIKPTDLRSPVNRVIFFGDSLSDRGTMNREKLLGFFPMSTVSGLDGVSPQHRFTNGMTWSDYFISALAADFKIDQTKQYLRHIYTGSDDVSDALISQDSRSHWEQLKNCEVKPRKRALCDDDIINGSIKEFGHDKPPEGDGFGLNNDKSVTYRGRPWIHTYCIGGLTAHNYSWEFTTNISQFFSRLILDHLSEMRNKLFAYDKDHLTTEQSKKQSLIIEWSGANDLITVNNHPTKAIADTVVKERLNNLRLLIAAGYSNFALINQPDLALTPRFQAKSQKARDNATECCDYLNAQLKAGCEELAKEFPACQIDVFDINTSFKEIYNNPQKYGFDPEKMKQPYTTSKDFTEPKEGISPSIGYMFYDDVHPSSDAHGPLAALITAWAKQKYRFQAPDAVNTALDFASEAELLSIFQVHYAQKLNQDRNGFFKCLGAKSGLDYKHADLAEVIDHAMHGGKRTRQVLMNIGLMDAQGNPVMRIAAVAQALRESCGQPATVL